MTRIPPHQPIIAIIGATGTGKSQLAVEIAKRYNGEVINGDAMQLYAGLPIITNKITEEEQEGIPHHLLGRIGLHEQTWVVGTFVKEAMKTIDEIRSRGRLPILVGGTHYYTQSLLFHDRLAEDEDSDREFVNDTAEKWPILNESADVLLQELQKVDPIMAERWHPQDRRKIRRSLEIYLQTGRPASEIYAEQRAKKEDAALDGPHMRFPTLLLWVHAEVGALHARLNTRVEKMLAQGLLKEVEELKAFADGRAECGSTVDETKGIWVSIGYKEFKDYTQALQDSDVDQKTLARLKSEAVERTQISTRQYAKRQIRWIRVKLAEALAETQSSDQLYLLDGSDAARFNDTVVAPAIDLSGKFLRGEHMPTPSSLSTVAADMLQLKRDPSVNAERWTKQHCPVCNVTAKSRLVGQPPVASQ